MGQQQLLLLILGIIIVSIAIAVGFQLFQSGAIGTNQDAMVNDILNIVSYAEQLRVRPVIMSGGGGVFNASVSGSLNANTNLVKTENVDAKGYEVEDINSHSIRISGSSSAGYGDVILVYNSSLPNVDDRFDWSASTHKGGIGSGASSGCN